MATHSSSLVWKIPWMEEPGKLQFMESLGVGQDWATSLSLLTFMHWRRKWQPTPVLLPGESQGLGAWWAVVYGVARSQTWLKQLSSSSRFLHKWNFMVKLSLSYIVLEFVEKGYWSQRHILKLCKDLCLSHYQPDFLAFLISRNWSEARSDIQAGLYQSPCCRRGKWEQAPCSLLACFPQWKWASSLHGVRVGVCVQGYGWRVTSVVFPPLRWCCVQGVCAVPSFCSRFFQSGSWVFWSPCSLCPEFAPTALSHSHF